MSDEKHCCENHNKFWKGLFWGAVLGSVAGILFAPEKGERTRKILKRKAEDLKDKASELSQSLVEGKDELPTTLSKKVGEISDFLQKKKVDLEEVVKNQVEKVDDILEDTDDSDLQAAQPSTPKEVKKKPLKKGVKSFYKSGKH